MPAGARDSTAKYRRLVDQVIARIRSGELQPGEPLPSARSLYGEWGESTVLRAMAALKDESWIRAEIGRGYFVTDRPPPPTVEDRLTDHERRLAQIERRLAEDS